MAALYDTYAAGHYDQLGPAFPTADHFRRARSDIFQTAREWRAEWRPSRAAFIFDLALLGFQRSWEDATTLLAAGRDYVVTRPTPPGRSAPDDEVERAYHRAAFALLTGLGASRLNLMDLYLAPLGSRLSDGLASGVPAARLRDPRLAIVEGLRSELRTSPALLAESARDRPTAIAIAADDGDRRRQAEQAIVWYGRALLSPDTTPEAAVRRAFLLHRLGRHPEALTQISLADTTTDRVLAYWAALVKGRALEGAGRSDAAADAYEGARQLFPGAQTPLVALASLRQRQGRLDDGARYAGLVRASRDDSQDPWWEYWLGERRFLTERLATLRKVRP